jgi:hypothetical protein
MTFKVGAFVGLFVGLLVGASVGAFVEFVTGAGDLVEFPDDE